ncbi:hypothetical protein A2960_00100 [Candidatus Gottesmanbacteria bacterium RIFCSPLOWO2_01_FULL_39_12b]|uniref:Short-chain dehydrogenase n=1 Tax=Candidatus Gottesmanbacteria bacterium RIFCSPLOWO2_01_FULL_39_12b TaxID=1798388 RepID=A0A1F6AS73_9BACT|nr:MAG: hypothetical protein A2960_00100 [Candidatus Gottesmanbacteria bacterium RIFCSPLOWO2_01_FULL_39_12b]
MDSLKRKVVLITGAAGGIGSHIVSLFAQEEAILLLVSRDRKKLEDLQKKFEGKAKISYFPVNLKEETQIVHLVKTIKHKYAKLDVLINNAAVIYVRSINKFSTYEFEETMAVNFRAVFLLTKHLFPLLKKSKSGHIINIASISAHHGWIGGGLYCASKFALLGFSESLREELKRYHIRVSVISPGRVNTKMSLLPKMHPDKVKILQPLDVAELVLYTAKLPENVYFPEAIIKSL